MCCHALTRWAHVHTVRSVQWCSVHTYSTCVHWLLNERTKLTCDSLRAHYFLCVFFVIYVVVYVSNRYVPCDQSNELLYVYTVKWKKKQARISFSNYTAWRWQLEKKIHDLAPELAAYTLTRSFSYASHQCGRDSLTPNCHIYIRSQVGRNTTAT